LETEDIEISQNRASYIEVGEGVTTILMIHGNSLRKEAFQPQFDSSLNDHFRLVAVDLPGHGDFERKSESESLYSIEGLVEFVDQFCQKMNFEQLVLFGHSLGGHLAIEAASGIESVKGIIALGTPPLTSMETSHIPFLEHPAFPSLLQGELSDDQVDQLARSFWKDGEDVPVWIAESIKATDPEFRSSFGKNVAAGALKDEVAEMKKLHFPVALAVGEHDTLINRQYIQEVAGEIMWNKSVQVINDAGHSAHAEKPDQMNRLIFDYVSSL